MRDPLDAAKYIFINDENELRSGWRVLFFFLCFAFAAALLTGLTKALATLFPTFSRLRSHELGSLLVSNLTNFVAAVVASAICARRLERRSLASIGFKFHRRWLRDFSVGSLMGAAALSIAVGVVAWASSTSFEVQTRVPGLVRGFAIALLFFLIAGATEELLFRGFPFQALVHNIGGAKALAITSAIFGLAHLGNENASTLSTINTMLAGGWLGLAYLMTRNLWLATALHYSWNFTMSFVFGLPVSGFTMLGEFAWLRGNSGAPWWISGGSYGPEAGIGATLALILSALAIWKSGLFAPSEEMVAAVQHGNRAPGFISIDPEKQ